MWPFLNKGIDLNQMLIERGHLFQMKTRSEDPTISTSVHFLESIDIYGLRDNPGNPQMYFRVRK